MIYSLSEAARHSRPSLQSAAATLQEASARVRNSVQALAHEPDEGSAVRIDLSDDPLARVESSVRATVTSTASLDAVRQMASAASQQLAAQVLPMANDRPQAIAAVAD